MRSDSVCLSEILLDFAEISRGSDENFPFEQTQVGHFGKVV